MNDIAISRRARLISQTTVYVCCPNCGEQAGSISHLLQEARRPYQFGPWYCDSCGRSYSGTIEAEDSVSVEAGDDFIVKTLDLLVLPPHKTPIYFAVEGMRSPQQGGDNDDSKTYFYEEHTCPTNVVRCEAIIADGDADPHGIFKYVRSVDWPAKADNDDIVDVKAIFPETMKRREDERS